MRILFIDFTLPYLLKDSEYPVGGWAVELNTWLTGLRANKIKVGVLTWEGATKYVDRKVGFDLVETYDQNKGIKIVKYFNYFIPAMLKASRKYNPDVIIQACSGLNTGIMAFIADRLKVPFIYRVANDMDADERHKNRLLKYEQLAYHYGLKRSSGFLCQNSYQIKCLRERFPTKPAYVLHNPFDTKRIISDPRSIDEKDYIAWLGVFSEQKNMPLLYEIASKLSNITFKVAGMPGTGIDDLTKSAVNSLRLLPNVKFEGYVKRSEIIDFLSGAKALLSTSHYEGFSNTFLESFTAGTPVIAPIRVDPDLIITRQKLGLTAKNDNEIVSLIKQISGINYDEYKEMSYRCQNYVVANHAPEVKARELTNIIESMLKRGSN